MHASPAEAQGDHRENDSLDGSLAESLYSSQLPLVLVRDYTDGGRLEGTESKTICTILTEVRQQQKLGSIRRLECPFEHHALFHVDTINRC